MLEGLDTIDWSQINSENGPAMHIPTAIREIVSENDEIRQRGYDTLCLSLEDQGLVYQAAAYAVPFLLEILDQPHIKGKEKLLEMLLYLGCKDAYHSQHYQCLEEHLRTKQRKEWEKSSVSFMSSQTIESEHYFKVWGERTAQAVHEGLPLFLMLLDESDPVVRIAALNILAYFEEDRSKIVPSIRAKLATETNENVIACLLAVLGQLLPLMQMQLMLSLFLPYLGSKNAAIVRFSVATVFCAFPQVEIPEEVSKETIDVFLSALEHPSSLCPAYDLFPPAWDNKWINLSPLFYLDQLLSSPHKAFIIEEVIKGFPLFDDYNELECADFLLRATFSEEHFPAWSTVAFRDLTFLQQTVLRTLVEKGTFWLRHNLSDEIFEDFIDKFSPFSFDTLRLLGLPSTLPQLQTFISTASQ